ncbi:MAG TPA: tripartite tricarboxylate transporter substrate binding protein [Bordetella sp.]
MFMHRCGSVCDRSSIRRVAAAIAPPLGGAAIAMLAAMAPAQAAYPDHSITLVVPYAPGGGVDGVARVFARALGEKLGQSVVVENHAGAGAMIGIDYVNRARPDGYTLLVVDPAFVINPSLQPHVPYKVEDFKPISIMTGSPLVLVSAKDSKFKSFDAMLKMAKSDGVSVTFATPGIGTTPHMAGELLREIQGAHMMPVAYKGSGPAATDVLSGQVDVGFMSITAASSFLKQGNLQGLATTGEKRASVLPDLPTIAELTKSDYSVLFWVGCFAPAKVPEEVRKKLDETIQAIATDPTYAKGLASLGETSVGSTSEVASQYVASEYGKWSALISTAHIKGAE